MEKHKIITFKKMVWASAFPWKEAEMIIKIVADCFSATWLTTNQLYKTWQQAAHFLPAATSAEITDVTWKLSAVANKH